jgi:hypothetical protein
MTTFDYYFLWNNNNNTIVIKQSQNDDDILCDHYPILHYSIIRRIKTRAQNWLQTDQIELSVASGDPLQIPKNRSPPLLSSIFSQKTEIYSCTIFKNLQSHFWLSIILSSTFIFFRSEIKTNRLTNLYYISWLFALIYGNCHQ